VRFFHSPYFAEIFNQPKNLTMKIKFFLILFFSIWLSQLGFAQVYILNEDFSSASGTIPPVGWSNLTVTGSANDLWRFNNPGSRQVI